MLRVVDLVFPSQLFGRLLDERQGDHRQGGHQGQDQAVAEQAEHLPVTNGDHGRNKDRYRPEGQQAADGQEEEHVNGQSAGLGQLGGSGRDRDHGQDGRRGQLDHPVPYFDAGGSDKGQDVQEFILARNPLKGDSEQNREHDHGRDVVAGQVVEDVARQD